jgi:hypothetical protein
MPLCALTYLTRSISTAMLISLAGGANAQPMVSPPEENVVKSSPRQTPPKTTSSQSPQSRSTTIWETPVTGSDEWKAQKAAGDARDRDLDRRIHGICRGC